ncbi:hypothetical protein Micbo1qcDRAFT_203888 [Microdochium bolleyi]|uniref:Uncharacterized protein n=1 Tax=Microdochium bolleyi TaxID=196109 RepID=A0A136J421_9PEZI|nr:hypothetical protein Micbo1qcDRAFT_203888 [Microdochium bolleyi]
MHFTNAAKAVFFIINHVVAAHVPHDAEALYRRVHNARGATDEEFNAYGVKVTPRSTDQHGGALGADNLLFMRQSCEPKCRRKCPRKTFFIDPGNCRRCLPCPPKTTADPTYRSCIPEKMSKEEKEKRFPEKKKEKKQKWKKDKFDTKKPEKKNVYEEREKRNKVRRLGRCLTIVPLVMGAKAAEEFGSEFFDEDYLDSLALLDLWPADEQIDPWLDEKSDDLFESDWYLDLWVNYANAQPQKRSPGNESEEFQPRDPTVPEAAEENTELAVRDHDLHKRFFWLALIPIATAAVSAGARVGARVAAAAAKGAVNVSKYTMKIAKGGSSKRSKKEKDDAASKVSKHDKWRQCLRKSGP